MEVALAGLYHVVENAAAGTEAGGVRRPLGQSLTAHGQLVNKVRTPGARALAFHLRHDRSVNLEALQRRQTQLPARRGAVYLLRLRREMNDGLARHQIQPAVVK